MKIFIIGTGNVAYRLGKSLGAAGHTLCGVWGRDGRKSAGLARKFRCDAFSDLKKIPLNADVYLVAIKDDAIASVARGLPAVKGIVAHTSGASPLSLLKRFDRHGVFYPVETITRTYPRSFRKVPFCIEGSDDRTFRKLVLMAKPVTREIYYLTSGQRTVLHVAAVFTNNFTNYLLGVATGILQNENLPPALLRTLAESTVRNAFEKGAFRSQTGPAIRNDVRTIARHLKLLRKNSGYAKIYKLITEQIQHVHNIRS